MVQTGESEDQQEVERVDHGGKVGRWTSRRNGRTSRNRRWTAWRTTGEEVRILRQVPGSQASHGK